MSKKDKWITRLKVAAEAVVYVIIVIAFVALIVMDSGSGVRM